MKRVQVTLDEENLAYLKRLVRSGDSASLSHAIRKIIARVRKEEREKKEGG
jgi:Arc/MetJ-type ribon-helix-helix transcriptional regulator